MMLVANQTRKADCMMKSIVEEKLVSFKTLEQKVFAYVCELGRMITQIILNAGDSDRLPVKKTYEYYGKSNLRQNGDDFDVLFGEAYKVSRSVRYSYCYSELTERKY